MKKMLLSVALAGFIVMSGITASQQLEGEFFDIVVPENNVDEYPNSSSWSSFGDTENFQTGTNYSLEVTDPNNETATFESDLFLKSDLIEIERLLVDVEDSGSQDRKEMFLNYYDQNGTVVDSQNVTLERGFRSYDVEDAETEYYGYSYIINVDTDSSVDGSPSIDSVSMDYTLYQELTDGIPIDLSQIILWLSIIMGMVIAFVGTISGALNE